MIDMDRINERLARFRNDLSSLPVGLIVQRHITFGDCFVLDESQHFSLKSDVAAHFSIHHSEIMVVGSGKLGFSIAPEKRYRPFGDSSDIDLAVVSGRLFDDTWQQVFNYWNLNGGLGPNEQWFKRCVFRGWIRPDLLPTDLPARAQWWDYFLELTSSGTYGPYRVRGALFKSPHFLEGYQGIMVRQCHDEREATP
jgi:hypothetical protein